MPRKNALPAYRVASSQSLGATFSTTPTNILYLDSIGIQINITSGTPSGLFTVEMSLDYSPGSPDSGTINAGTWTDIGVSPTLTETSGSPATFLVNCQQLAAPWIRVTYTRSSGTGTADIYLSAKSLGG